jgi:hypothetical protein
MTTSNREWLDLKLEHLNGRPLAQARLLLCSDDLPAAWDKLDELGEDVEQQYWREFSPYGRGGDFKLVNEGAERLFQHGRPLAALMLLQIYLNVSTDIGKPSPELVAQGLETLVRLPKDHAEPARMLSSYALQGLLDYLRSSNLDEDRLAVLEWQLLPARGFDEHSPVLERRLARDPAFFVEIMSMCFRRSDGTTEHDVPEAVARNAYRLLGEWKIVPGSDTEGGEVNESDLTEWVTQARALAAERDRTDICDLYIGHVLAYAREDADGSWPTLPVRNVIDKLANPKIENGFRTETYNKRGVVTRGLSDGGQQERVLAAQFDQWAHRVADRWPRTAAVLRSLTETYQAEARREDEEAERFKRGLE